MFELAPGAILYVNDVKINGVSIYTDITIGTASEIKIFGSTSADPAFEICARSIEELNRIMVLSESDTRVCLANREHGWYRQFANKQRYQR